MSTAEPLIFSVVLRAAIKTSVSVGHLGRVRSGGAPSTWLPAEGLPACAQGVGRAQVPGVVKSVGWAS